MFVLHVTETPDGDVDESIRRIWVNKNLSLNPFYSPVPAGKARGLEAGQPYLGGFCHRIVVEEAIASLRYQGAPEAAKWWEEYPNLPSAFCFNYGCGEVREWPLPESITIPWSLFEGFLDELTQQSGSLHLNLAVLWTGMDQDLLDRVKTARFDFGLAHQFCDRLAEVMRSEYVGAKKAAGQKLEWSASALLHLRELADANRQILLRIGHFAVACGLTQGRPREEWDFVRHVAPEGDIDA